MKSLISLVLLGCASAAAFAADCGLVFNVLDLSGGEAVPYKVRVFDATTGDGQFAARFQGLRIDKVPCGEYRYVVVRADIDTGFEQLSGLVELEDPRQRVTLEINGARIYPDTGLTYPVDTGRAKDRPILGAVSGLKPSAKPAWIRLIDALGNRTPREVEVGPDGHFEIHYPSAGTYVILLLQDNRVLSTQTLVLDFAKDQANFRVRIDLPAS